MDLRLGLALAAVATLALLGSVVVLRRERLSLLVQGLLRGAAAAIVIFVIATSILTVLFNGRQFIFSTLDLRGAFFLAALISAGFAIVFLCVGAALVALGILIKPNNGWVKVGAWVTAPVAAAGMVLVVLLWNNFLDVQSQPTEVSGTVRLALADNDGWSDDYLSAEAVCSLQRDGTFSVSATSPSRMDRVALTVTSTGEPQSLQVALGGVEASSGKGFEVHETVRLINRSSDGGEVVLTNLVPMTADGEPEPSRLWSGTMSWTCGVTQALTEFGAWF